MIGGIDITGFICTNCGVELDPDNDDLWLLIDHKQDVVRQHDGYRDFWTETLRLMCTSCDHTDEYSSSWISDPRSEDD